MIEDLDLTQAERIELTAIEYLGRDLKALLLDEIKALPDVWQKLPERQQEDVLDRIESRLRDAVTKSITLIASNGGVKVSGVLESVQIKDKIKAVMIIDIHNHDDAKHELYNSANQPCLIVMPHAESALGGMDEVGPDPDQADLLNEDHDEAA